MFRSLLIAAAAVAGLVVSTSVAEAQSTQWSATITAERHIFDGDTEQKPYIGYFRVFFGEISDDVFEYNGVTYTVNLFYITNDPRSLLVGLRSAADQRVLFPDDPTLELRVDGKTFALSDVSRISGNYTVVWDNSGLDWSDGQRVSVELIGGAVPTPALPLAAAGLLALLLGAGAYRRVAGRS